MTLPSFCQSKAKKKKKKRFRYTLVRFEGVWRQGNTSDFWLFVERNPELANYEQFQLKAYSCFFSFLTYKDHDLKNKEEEIHTVLFELNVVWFHAV